MFGLFKKSDPAAAAVEASRSPKWPSFLKAFLKGKTCVVCGAKDGLTGHHVVPFHVDPSRELDPTNVEAVCEEGCHLIVGHLHDWRLWNKDFRTHAATLLAARRAAIAAAKEAA